MFIILKYDSVNLNTLKIIKEINNDIKLKKYFKDTFNYNISKNEFNMLTSYYYNIEIYENIKIFNTERNINFFNSELNETFDKLYIEYKNNLIKLKLKSLK